MRQKVYENAHMIIWQEEPRLRTLEFIETVGTSDGVKKLYHQFQLLTPYVFLVDDKAVSDLRVFFGLNPFTTGQKTMVFCPPFYNTIGHYGRVCMGTPGYINYKSEHDVNIFWTVPFSHFERHGCQLRIKRWANLTRELREEWKTWPWLDLSFPQGASMDIHYYLAMDSKNFLLVE